MRLIGIISAFEKTLKKLQPNILYKYKNVYQFHEIDEYMPIIGLDNATEKEIASAKINVIDSMKSYQSDKWFDGTSWQIKLPGDWLVIEKQSSSIKLKKDRSHITIGVSKKTQDMSSDKSYENDLYNSMKATIWPFPLPFPFWKKKPIKTQIGILNGFSYLQKRNREFTSWNGRFIVDSWRLYASLNSLTETYKQDIKDIHQMLNSFQAK